jgi:hypothetical protein
MVVLLVSSAHAAFNPPTVAPPGGNVDVPVYSVGTNQTLSGGLQVTSGGLTSTLTSGTAVIGSGGATGLQGSGTSYGLQGTLVSDSGAGDAALYANAFSADSDDYSAVFYGGYGVQMASGDVFNLNRDTGITWPRVSDGAALYGVSVTTLGELRLLGHGAGINFLDQNVVSRMSISEAGVVNVASGGSLKVNNVDVCLSDGTNCQVGSTPTLQTVTDVGASSSNSISLTGSADLTVADGGAFGGYVPSGTHKVTTPTLYAEQAQIGAATGGLKGVGTINAAQLCINGTCQSSWPSVGESDTLQTVTDRGSVTTKSITVASIDTGTGQGAAEVYLMNQNVRTSDAVSFSSVSGSGSGLTSLNASNLSSGTVADARLSANVSLLGSSISSSEIQDATITFADWASNSCSTNQIPKWNGSAWACAADDGGLGGEADTLQSVTDRGNTTTQAITVATINTGLGANELYAMDQHVRTSDSPTFASPTLTGSLTLGGVAVSEFSTDGTLSGNSDTAVPTEKAVKTYVDAAGTGLDFEFVTGTGGCGSDYCIVVVNCSNGRSPLEVGAVCTADSVDFGSGGIGFSDGRSAGCWATPFSSSQIIAMSDYSGSFSTKGIYVQMTCVK